MKKSKIIIYIILFVILFIAVLSNKIWFFDELFGYTMAITVAFIIPAALTIWNLANLFGTKKKKA